MSKHTPTPWKTIQAGNGLGIVPVKRPDGVSARDVEDIALLNLYSEQHDARANGAFIIRAVNCHEELVAALEAVTSMPHIPVGDKMSVEEYREISWRVEKAVDVLSKARRK